MKIPCIDAGFSLAASAPPQSFVASVGLAQNWCDIYSKLLLFEIRGQNHSNSKRKSNWLSIGSIHLYSDKSSDMPSTMSGNSISAYFSASSFENLNVSDIDIENSGMLAASDSVGAE